MEMNPFSYEFHADPYPVYRWMRDEAPCYHNEELGFWALSRYADVLEASHDWRTYSSADGPMIEKTSREMLDALPMMISMDPPPHDVLRGLVSRVFTPRRIDGLADDVRALCGELLDPLVEQGGGDFVRDFSALLPMNVIFTLLGVPEEPRRMLREWIDLSLDRDEDSPDVPRRAVEASAHAAGWWFERVAELRAHPGDDFVSRLLEAEIRLDEGVQRRLTDQEVVGFCTLISFAGNETVTKLLGNAAVLLHRHPDQRRALAGDPTGVPRAVDEVLRYWAPSQYQGRSATRDVEVHGRVIPEGDRVVLVTGAANRDDRVYDDPDRFDVAREPGVPGMGFGHGVHFCLGASLARMESRIGLEEVGTRFPDFEVDESGLERVHMSNVHGFSAVPFSAA